MAINNPYYILWVLRHILWAFRKPLSFSIVSQFFSDVSVPGAARFSFYAHINLSSETTCTVHAHRTPTPTNNCKFKKVQYTRMKRWPCVFWVFSYVINIVCTPLLPCIAYMIHKHFYPLRYNIFPSFECMCERGRRRARRREGESLYGYSSSWARGDRARMFYCIKYVMSDKENAELSLSLVLLIFIKLIVLDFR